MDKLETKGFNGLMAMVQAEAQKKENFGNDFNVSETGDFYKLMAPIIYCCSYLEDKIISIARGLNIYNAQGEELDNLLYFFPRRFGSKALLHCKVTATNFVDVIEGDIVIQAENGARFENVERFEIDSSKTKIVLFRALVEGENGNIQKNKIEKVIKAPASIVDVQNTEIGEGGLNAEEDYLYLKRYLAGNGTGEWSLQPVLNAVRRLPGVKNANGIRNNTMQVDKFGLAPKSIWIVVDGGVKEEIAQTIYMHIHTPDTRGSIEVQVETSVENHRETIRFDRPVEAEVEYKLLITSMDSLKIKKLLEEYLDNAGIGALLSAGTFLTDWMCGKGFKYTDFDLKFRKKRTTSWTTSLQLGFNERSKNGGEAI
ncbi:baseplate J/gp47 family protein [Fusobacterium gastrosuis]|uniref:baseplate J/gp47 family protein n=1 Tax=Fusobacterium gastrosuis TaxID=1755100 RepID=UPI0029706AD9|nr:baseplate J/gp47 family protein [Fusobacteriaceae bacterium]MDY5712372.1 baseplate J/gp47 family protein [Fusobacterium gastrosuis]